MHLPTSFATSTYADGGCMSIKLLFWPVRVSGRQLGFGLLYDANALSRYTVRRTSRFLVRQLLTLSLRVDPLSRTHVSRLSHTALRIIIDCFNFALFSALGQTHCAHVACDSEWVTASFYSAFNIQRNGVLTALFGCYMAAATWNCCCLGARCVYTIQPCSSLFTYT